jgi:rare lipoprotein A
VLSKLGRAELVRLACIGLSASALATIALTIKFATPAEAKTPGSTYCYHGTCHRVKTLAETQALVGVEETLYASHYDDCSKDRYNPCGLTSSGERFHPDRPDNTASPIYPDGTVLLVWSPDNQQALVVRVNNAGPYWGNRTLDLSRAAAQKLGFEGSGVAKLRVRVVKAPEPAEAKYSDNRTYAPVLGDIGHYENMAAADTGMTVAMAIQSSSQMQVAATSGSGAYSQVAFNTETPQALGRNRISLVGFAVDHRMSQSVVRPKGQLAALGLLHDGRQSIWGEDSVGDSGAAPEVQRPVIKSTDTAKNDTPTPIKDTAVAPIKVAAVEEPAPEPKRVVRRKSADDEETSAKSRKAHVDTEGRTRSKRTARAKYRDPDMDYSDRSERGYSGRGYAMREYREAPAFHQVRERSAEQVMSAGLRAESSSTM